MGPSRPTIGAVRQAAFTLREQIVRTPFSRSRVLSELTGCDLWIKFENLQYTASFKERGALNRLAALAPAERERGVIAMSAGNHAQGVAYHAGRLGIPATIVMPRSTPLVKVAHTEKHGARTQLVGDTLAEAAAEAHRLAAKQALTFIHPYDDPLVICGQGTVALEMLEDVPDLELMIVPIGGGGLIAGMALAGRAINPRLRIVGVEVERYPAMLQVLQGHKPGDGGDTVAEGIAVKDVGMLTREMVRDTVDDIVLVSEADVEHAIACYASVEKTVAEGAGAVALAAALRYPALCAGRKTGVVLSGGNIDTRVLASVLLRQMVRDGRIASLRIGLPDKPGSLGDLATRIGAAGASIIEVSHQRLFSLGGVKTADVELTIECRSAEHGDRLVTQLEDAGYAVVRTASGAA
jgi:threonine dehydratase